jgi:hypothetical protein
VQGATRCHQAGSRQTLVQALVAIIAIGVSNNGKKNGSGGGMGGSGGY